MPDEEPKKIIVVAEGDLGPGNQGQFGPASERERQAHKSAAAEYYWRPRQIEKSGCMDDRLEGLYLHLAGNRAITEVASDFSDGDIEVQPLSKAMSQKIRELVAMGHIPVFHEGCAALASIRSALGYNAEHENEVADALWPILERLGLTEFLTKQRLHDSIKAGKTRYEDDRLWDASAEDLMRIAAENGAEIIPTPGDHCVAANLDNLSGQSFDNGRFRSEHPADDGRPAGFLTIDWAGYRDQLVVDGYTQEETAVQLMLSGLFIVGVEKMINKDGSPRVVAGDAV